MVLVASFYKLPPRTLPSTQAVEEVAGVVLVEQRKGVRRSG
jgi:hypothetical protein